MAVGCGRVDFDSTLVTPPAIRVLVPEEAVAVTEGSTCALRASGDLFCWGANYAGEVGVGDYNPRTLPVQVGAPGGWRRVTAGMDHICAVAAGGGVYCWGSNGGGAELGVGDYAEHLVPTHVDVPGTVVAVASAGSTTNGLTANGTRWGWGDNRGDGAIGDGTLGGPVVLPVATTGGPWSSIAVGLDRACAIDLAGGLWCWGYSDSIGTGDKAQHLWPVQIAADEKWLAVAAGYHTCALRDDQHLFCWGDNSRGELGDGTTATALVPEAIAPAQTFRAIGTGLYVTCAIDTDGGLWCVGANDQGQLGVGDTSDRHTLAPVMAGTRWTSVRSAPWFVSTCAIKEDHAVYCWGRNAEGQLGQGTDLTAHTTPVQVMLP